MNEKDNCLKNAELTTEQNYNMIDGIPNNAPLPVQLPPGENGSASICGKSGLECELLGV